MIRSLVVLCLLAACHPSAAPSTPAGRLSVEVALYVQRDGKRVEVPPDGVVHSNEVFDFEVTPSQPAYVYVGLQHADGSRDVLFPDRDDQVLVGQTRLEIPGPSADSELYFDDTPGEETLVVIASLQPLSQVDAAAYRLAFAPEPEARAGSAEVATAPAAVDAGMVPTDAAVAAVAPPPDAGAPSQRSATHGATHVRISSTAGEATHDSSALRARGVKRRTKRPVIDADASNIVIFPYVVDHRP